MRENNPWLIKKKSRIIKKKSRIILEKSRIILEKLSLISQKLSLISIKLALFFLLVFSLNSFSQENLIYNPSFEEYLACPQKIEPYGYMSQAMAWWQPTGGSADYYNKCGAKQTTIPKNKLGVQMPRTGVGMVGIYTSKTTYREYIQTELKEYLEEGKTYRLCFYVSLSEYSSGAVATIGGLFTPHRIEEDTREMLTEKKITKLDNGVSQSISTYLKPQIVNPFDNPIVDVENWVKIEGEFIAKGGEKFLTIGNFYPAQQSNVVDLPYLTYLLPGAYYYIDDVSLICLDCNQKIEYNNNITITKTKNEPHFEVGQVVIMENIFFEFDKSVLLPQSYVELHNLISLLEKHSSMRIELSGHTDNMGSDHYNNNLSQSRVKAVYNYLISQGVAPNRLRYTWHGAKQPIADNKTEEARAKNRRVEFKILEL